MNEGVNEWAACAVIDCVEAVLVELMTNLLISMTTQPCQ